MSDPVDKVAEYDRSHGTYKPELTNLPDATKLPQGALPKAPDPKPFGNLGGGGGGE